MHVHVVGNVCIDTTFHLQRLPRVGETVNAGRYADGIGGKGANQAVAAAATGVAVSLWAAIGDDANGRWIAERLAGRLAPRRLTTLPLPSDRSTIIVDAAGENVVVSGVACAAAFDPLRQTGFAAAIAAGDFVVLQGNLTPPVTAACLEAAKSRGATTILNPSPLASASGFDLASANVVIANEGEAAELTGETDPGRAIRALLHHSAMAAVVTLGARGCLIASAESDAPVHLPATPVAVVDTSGAGDVFCGAVAGMIAQGWPLARAARLAARAAALSVGRHGTFDACPNPEEFRTLMQTIEMETA